MHFCSNPSCILSTTCFHTLFIGHSFINHLKPFIASGSPVMNVVNLNLDPQYFVNTLVGRSGATAGGRRSIQSALHVIDQINPNMVFLEIGSNDLCDENREPMHISVDIVSLARFIKIGYGISCVVIGKILPRTHRVDMNAYNIRVGATNRHIRHLASQELGIYTWRHRGFSNPTINPFHTDGVHLNKTHGIPKYIRSLRHAVLFHRVKMFSTCITPIIV